MEQLLNLATQYALGLRRLELEEEQEQAATATAGAAEQRYNNQEGREGSRLPCSSALAALRKPLEMDAFQ